jgi:hypothetical protein
MSEMGIKLGDEIEDVTAKVVGIAIGRVEYLDGSKAWLMQPPYSDDGNRVPVVEVQDAYARRIGDGVYVERKPVLGFHAREVSDAS